jgi:beta-lactamase regulating signal transducer with metallopeptidase domain
MNSLLYLIQLNLYLVLFYGLYLLLLRKETFFRLNRLYLISSTLLAITIPFINTNWIIDLFDSNSIYKATQQVSFTINTVVLNNDLIDSTSAKETMTTAITDPGISLNQIIWMVYAVVTSILLVNFLWKLKQMSKAIHASLGYQAYSFFGNVIIGDKLANKETIHDHEMVHVTQWHSLDIIFFELLSIFNWFNPVSFAYKNAIKSIHEYIADEIASQTLGDKSTYALVLVSNAFSTHTNNLTNNFYNPSLLKRRLIMLNKNKSRKLSILKYGLSVPLFAIMLIFSSATIERSELIKTVVSDIKSIPMVAQSLINEEEPLMIENALLIVSTKVAKSSSKKVDVPLKENNIDSPALKAIFTHFAKNIKYPPVDQENKAIGTSYLTFELDDSGLIQNAMVAKAMSEGSKAEIVRVVKKATQPFGPGLTGKYILPIKYSLSISYSDELLSGAEDSFDLKPYGQYKKLTDLIIRGYVAIPEEKRLAQFREYVSKNLKYPAEAQKDNLSSFSFITLELDQSGKIINSSHIYSNGQAFEKELNKVLATKEVFEGAPAGKYLLPVHFMMKGNKGNYGLNKADFSTSKGYITMQPIRIVTE